MRMPHVEQKTNYPWLSIRTCQFLSNTLFVPMKKSMLQFSNVFFAHDFEVIYDKN